MSSPDGPCGERRRAYRLVCDEFEAAAPHSRRFGEVRVNWRGRSVAAHELVATIPRSSPEPSLRRDDHRRSCCRRLLFGDDPLSRSRTSTRGLRPRRLHAELSETRLEALVHRKPPRERRAEGVRPFRRSHRYWPRLAYAKWSQHRRFGNEAASVVSPRVRHAGPGTKDRSCWIDRMGHHDHLLRRRGATCALGDGSPRPCYRPARCDGWTLRQSMRFLVITLVAPAHWHVVPFR